MTIEEAIKKLDRIDDIVFLVQTLANKIEKKPQDETGGIELAQKITGLSKSRIYQLVMARRIPFKKVPGLSKLFFNESDLKNWINGKSSKK